MGRGASAPTRTATPALRSCVGMIWMRCQTVPKIFRRRWRLSLDHRRDPAAAKSSSMDSAVANCRQRNRFARYASIRILSRLSTTNWVSAGSRFSRSRELISSGAQSISTLPISSGTRATLTRYRKPHSYWRNMAAASAVRWANAHLSFLMFGATKWTTARSSMQSLSIHRRWR